MKTIQIKVTIDGVNYLSEEYDSQDREYIDNEVEKNRCRKTYWIY